MTTTEDLAHEFQTSGFLHVKSAISKSSCEKLIWRMKDLVWRFAAHDRSKIFETGSKSHTSDEHFVNSAQKISFFFDKNSSANKSIFGSLNKVGHALHDLCPVYKKFSHQDAFYSLARTLGHRAPKLVQSMFIFKQPQFGDEVPAHQDATFMFTQPQSLLGFWIALQDADEHNGCLWVLPGGHRGLLKERFRLQENKLIFNSQQRVNWPARDFVSLPAKAGDIIVLHGLLPHKSAQNRSHKTRFAYTLHFVDDRSYYPKDNWLRIR
jgi:phytanoyl-CoA hydroxylase